MKSRMQKVIIKMTLFVNRRNIYEKNSVLQTEPNEDRNQQL